MWKKIPVAQNNLYDDEDDELLLNPIHLIRQYEMEEKKKNINENLNIKDFKDYNPLENNDEITNNINHKINASMNSSQNTCAAVENSFNENKINYNISFFALDEYPKKDEKKELTQKSIEILSDFISKEEKIKEKNVINDNYNQSQNKKFGNIIKGIKENLEKLDKKLVMYFENPYMRKNYEKNKLFKKPIINDEKEEKNINIFDNNNDSKMETNKININNMKEI